MVIFLIIFSSLLLIATFLPVIKHESWVFRVFDYPRLQKLALSGFIIGLLLFFPDWHNPVYLVLLVLMILNMTYLAYQIFPFTPLAKKQVLRIASEMPEQGLSLMISNVYQDNKNYDGCLKEISKANPDVLLLLETDTNWAKALEGLAADFPYSVLIPLENTYGMLLYSKLELKDFEVKYLVEPDIPSIHTKILLPNNQPVQLFAVHPTPPVPNENPRSTERDKELLLVADLAKESELPVIVIGDLNDVAWSYTTELFLKMSGLLDPRRGRGFFNSFHAHYPFLRFPLDHAFISPHLKLKEMRRLSNFDSDHFPIFISIQYEELADEQQEELQPDQEDVEIAEEKKAAV